MDQKLLRWARTRTGRQAAPWPAIWLFTDTDRLPDPLAAVCRLPRGLAGVVFRPDGLAAGARATLGRALAKTCRARRLMLVVAGDRRLAAALGAGVHLREGRWPGSGGRIACKSRITTSSAHGTAGLIRAHRAGARLVFLSPLLPTASHPGAPSLGPVRFAALARQARGAAPGLAVAALGGIDGSRAAWLASPLGRDVLAVGAIGALG